MERILCSSSMTGMQGLCQCKRLINSANIANLKVSRYTLCGISELYVG